MRCLKEAQRVRLNDLTEVHQAAQLFCSRRNGHGENRITSLGGRKQMADRTDAADAAGDAGHFTQRTAFTEFLEPAELHDVKLRVCDGSCVIQMDGDLGVALDAGHRVNNDTIWHIRNLFEQI